MFQPESETEEFYQYSVAKVRPNLTLYAQDGSGTSLGLAYQLMYNRFRGFMGFGNKYSYYNPYYYGGYYNDYTFNKYTLAGHTMYVPWASVKTVKIPRKWSRNDKSTTTNLITTRTTTESNYNSTNSSNVSSTRSSSKSSSSSNSGTRATRRN